MFNPPAIDLSISELLSIDLPKRAKIVGIVVSVGNGEFTINDGKDQISVYSGEYTVESGKFYRLVLNVREDKSFEAIAVHPIREADVEKYWKIVQLERRVKRRWQ